MSSRDLICGKGDGWMTEEKELANSQLKIEVVEEIKERRKGKFIRLREAADMVR